MSHQYPFLAAGLPDLASDPDARTFQLSRLKEEVEELLRPDDLEALQWLFYPFDNQNLVCLLQQSGDLSPLGSLTPEALHEGLEDSSGLPGYMAAFLDSYTGRDPNRPERIGSARPADDLAADFHEAAARHRCRFIRDWFTFDMEWKNVLAAAIAAKHRLSQRPVGENEVAEAIRTSQASDFGLKQQRAWVEPLLEALDMKNLVQRELKFDFIQWEQLDSMTALHHFDTEAVLAWMQKAIMVERRMQWNDDAGRQLFRHWIDDTQASADLEQILTK